MSQHLATAKRMKTQDTVDTDIPARLDRLPWSRFHWLLIIALGVTWILDGLEATVVAAISTVLTKDYSLNLTAGQMGLAGTLYLAGAIGGAVVLGRIESRNMVSIAVGWWCVSCGSNSDMTKRARKRTWTSPTRIQDTVSRARLRRGGRVTRFP